MNGGGGRKQLGGKTRKEWRVGVSVTNTNLHDGMRTEERQTAPTKQSSLTTPKKHGT